MKGYKQILGIGVGVALTALLTNPAFAFIGPETGQSPGTGGGLLYVDSSRNIGFGTTDPTLQYNFDDNSAAHGYIFMIASSSNPGIALKNLTSGVTYVWSVRGGGRLHLFREGGGYGGNIVMSVDWYGKVGINKFQATTQLDVGGGINADGSITASSTITGQSFSGIGTNITAINPANITGNPFASANYAFPSALAVGTSTTVGLPTEGLFVKGSVGIGTASPNDILHIANSSDAVLSLHRTTTGVGDTTGIQFKVSSDTADNYYNAGILFERTNEEFSTGGKLHFAMDAAGLGNAAVADTKMTILQGGNVGIASSSPGYKFTVEGTSYFGNEMTFAAGAQITMSTSTNAIDMAGGDITGVDKITVATLDPLYQIGTSKYATYVPSIVGGVKEEYVGKGRLTPIYGGLTSYMEVKPPIFEYVLDFSKVERGTDLWVWYKTVDFSRENVDVFVTPYGVPVNIYYIIEDNNPSTDSGPRIIFRANLTPNTYNLTPNEIEFSYRLVGKRFDWQEWPTYAKDQSERASFTISE